MNFDTNPIANSTTDYDTEFLCKRILYWELEQYKIRYWDIIVLVPNLVFFIYLLSNFQKSRQRLSATSTPIFSAFYGLVTTDILISCIRCIVSMLVNASVPVGGYIDKVLWVIVRWFLLSTEISVVTFALGCGRLDTRSSIKKVLTVTTVISFAYTFIQGVLEIMVPDDSFHIKSKDFDLYGHGGMIFWFFSSLIFTALYFFVFIMRWTALTYYILLPKKISFYVYIFSLATLNLIQTIGSGLLSYGVNEGLCIVNTTAYVYFTLLVPFVYWTFLSDFFSQLHI